MKRYFDIFKTMLRIANKHKFMVVQMFISCCIYNVSSLLPPIATAGIIAVISAKNFNGIWIYVLMYMIFYIMYFGFLHWNYFTYTHLADYYHLEVQRDLFNHISNNETIFNKMSKGKVIETCSDDIRYLVDIMDCASEALMGVIKLIVIFGIFCYYNIFVGLFAIVLDLLYLSLMNDNSKKVSKYYEGTRKYEDKVMDIFNQMLTNLKQVKSLNMMEQLDSKLDKTRKKWKEQYKGKRKNLTARYCIIPYIVYIGKILLYIFLGYLVINGSMSLDKLVLLISYFEMTITVTDKMLDYLLNLSNYGIRLNRIANILDYSSDRDIDYGEIDNDYINGTVVFQKVNYEIKGKKILNNVSFKVYPNEITAIVGKSGSGKSTIINLLYRLDRIKSGSILIDDESIYNYTKKVYSSNVSGVFQKPFMFEMSIKDNLSLIDSNIARQIEACKRVGMHDYIESLPKGYNTIINDESNLFSEGQKQLLVIARALLTKSEILLFDEVTSNIGFEATTMVSTVLNDLKSDHTIMLVTHKPEIMSLADRVVVLDKGSVVAKGKNKDVLEKCSLYQELTTRTFASVSQENI
ncbi:MAG: ABC transporter ATP-binding protein [Erysipelotrichales bacterium]|nr:ABC transporter ATP-binding protein [Erysipelotrichales bacterium]